MRRMILALVVFISLICLSYFALAQEPVASQEPAPVLDESRWVWGEVTAVDTNLGQLVIKYLDYETDEVKDMLLIVDPEATFENISGLKDIKIGDYASVDYIVNKENKNIAKNISVEKPETPSGETTVIPQQPKVMPEQTAPQATEPEAPTSIE
jgi:hypothetical protein